MRVSPPTTLVLLLSLTLGGVILSNQSAFAQGDPRFAKTFPVLTTITGAEFRDVVVVAADPVRLTFRHSGGLASLDWAQFPIEIRKTFNFRPSAPLIATIPSLETAGLTTYRNVIVVRTDPGGLTFRHGGGTRNPGAPFGPGVARLPFEQLPDTVRNQYDVKQDTGRAFRLPAFTTSNGTFYNGVVIRKTDGGGLTFRHGGGTNGMGVAFGAGSARLPFEVLPDDVSERYGYKQEAAIAFDSPTLTTAQGTVYRDIVPVRNDPVGLTFRHSGGNTSLGTAITPGLVKIPFEKLPDDVRQRYDYKRDLALEFVRTHTPAPPKPRVRFLTVTNGFVPAIATGRNTPGTGFTGRVPAVGARGFAPSIGFRGRIPAIGARGGVPATGFSGTPPAMGGAVPTPAIGVGTGR